MRAYLLFFLSFLLCSGLMAQPNGKFGGGNDDGYGSNTISVSLPLPIQFLDFRAQYLDFAVQLEWETEGEEHHSHYELERSRNGQDFVLFGIVPSRSIPGQIQGYQYEDANPLSGLSYYRIKSVDLDGNFMYSPIISMEVNPQLAGSYMTIFPNPTRGLAKIQLFSPQAEVVQIKLLNELGQICWESEYDCQIGLNEIELSLKRKAAGHYHVLIEMNAGKLHQKMVLLP